MTQKINSFFKLILVLVILFCANNSLINAQSDTTSNLRQIAGKAITDRFPTTRLVNVEYQYSSPVNFRMRTREKSIGETTIEEQNRARVNINVPFLKYKKWIFLGNVDYNYMHFSLKDFSLLQNEFSNAKKSNLEGHTFDGAVNAIYISKLLDRPLFVNLSVISHFSQKDFESITGLGFATIGLKKNKRTTMTAGLLVVVDPMMRFPFLPVFSFDHKFDNDWALTMTLPQQIFIRKSFSKMTRLSLGSYVNRNNYYIYPNNTNKVYMYNKPEINTGVVLEHYLNNHLILTGRTGLVNSLDGTIIENKKKYSKRILTTRQNAGMYFNVGLSYNLF